MGGRITVASEKGHGSRSRLRSRSSGKPGAGVSIRTRRRCGAPVASSYRPILRCATRYSLHLISWGMLVAAADSPETIGDTFVRAANKGGVADCAIVDGDDPSTAEFIRQLSDDHRYEDLQVVFIGSVPTN